MQLHYDDFIFICGLRKLGALIGHRLLWYVTVCSSMFVKIWNANLEYRPMLFFFSFSFLKLLFWSFDQLFGFIFNYLPFSQF